MPKVSVCIPTYNTAGYLGEAVESVLRQSFEDFELVVCDNASTDGTPELCRAYTDPRFRHVRFDEFVGQAANWNRCVGLAAGEYVVLLHADDVLEPRFLAAAVATLDQWPDVGLVHCRVQHVDAAGAPLYVQSLYPADRVDREDDLLRRLLLDGCVVNPAGVMARRAVFEAVGGFTEEIVWGVDWHMWARIAMRYPSAYLAQTLSRYRQHGASGTAGVMAVARNVTDEAWMMADLFRQLPAERAELATLRSRAVRGVAHRAWCFAEEMCRRGHMRSARRGLRRAVGIRPGLLLEARVWALWAATFLGYGWFSGAHGWLRHLRGEPPAP